MWYLTVVWLFVSVMISDAAHPFIYLSTISMSFFRAKCIQLLCLFFNWVVFVVESTLSVT